MAARDKYYPMMRMMDPENFFDDFARNLATPFFDNNFKGFGFNSASVDLYRKDGKIFVEAELPGINPDNVDLHVYGDRLTLSAEKKSETKDEAKDKSYFRSERSWGKIERVISFPVEADPESAKANFKNGVLTIEVAEKTQDKAHKKVSITAEA
ncbi:MAG: Hsp20/alpha crystallin family protein [Synergistaceae bacterium]|nr:Hsp20/alpha crystallin family protein [Synergistaceae bacterium]MBQ6435579.1 Hsp20/alpha crystallin family protein [Synergistaceae bacterium]MBQ6738414.1 Hsp20/alpha crystallin family protein [Synergistaceae bacterium]MBQ7068492.1 Hsp20/alpha crystallin family protein [Synergistaceae bacterium]MBR0079138.1 Hsp20/alpha crystallin family protein [Synergistaceae bacterium]